MEVSLNPAERTCFPAPAVGVRPQGAEKLAVRVPQVVEQRKHLHATKHALMRSDIVSMKACCACRQAAGKFRSYNSTKARFQDSPS